MKAKLLDIVIPVYNEVDNIVPTLQALQKNVRTPARVLICYDFEEDTTLTALRDYRGMPFELIRNPRRGLHGAVLAGFSASRAPFVVVYPADDHFNAGIVDSMVTKALGGCDVVCASRLMPGSQISGYPWLKLILMRSANYTLRHWAGLPTHDATSGFRLFSRRVLEQIKIESSVGLTYSIELLVKAHQRGWKIGEVPADDIARIYGTSRFKVFKWLPAYLKWYFYAFSK